MKRADVLDKAKQCVCRDREQEYGTPEDNFRTVGCLWSAYLTAARPELATVLPLKGITPKDVAIMMSLLKVARAATGNSPDSFVDLAGYAALAGEIATQDGEQKNVFTMKIDVLFVTQLSPKVVIYVLFAEKMSAAVNSVELIILKDI